MPGGPAARGLSGFTLVELLVVLAIVALVLALAVPNLSTATGGAELAAAGQRAVAVLRQTRIAAIEGNREVAFAPADLGLPERMRVAVEPESGVRFYPDGSSSGGRVTVQDAAGVRTAVVDWLTGRVRLVE